MFLVCQHYIQVFLFVCLELLPRLPSVYYFYQLVFSFLC